MGQQSKNPMLDGLADTEHPLEVKNSMALSSTGGGVETGDP